MPLTNPIHPGEVVWTGENPGILLKESDDGPFSAIALFFRIYYSPVGRGTALLILEEPNDPVSLPKACNALICDSAELAAYIKKDFIEKLPVFAALPGYQASTVVALTESYPLGDPRTCYREIIKTDALDIELVWDQLSQPTALELPAELTGAKENELYTILIESRDPTININGKRLRGNPVERIQAGIKTTTAFLYFSETWIRPA